MNPSCLVEFYESKLHNFKNNDNNVSSSVVDMEDSDHIEHPKITYDNEEDE